MTTYHDPFTLDEAMRELRVLRARVLANHAAPRQPALTNEQLWKLYSAALGSCTFNDFEIRARTVLAAAQEKQT
jgi:hypothetical protein